MGKPTKLSLQSLKRSTTKGSQDLIGSIFLRHKKPPTTTFADLLYIVKKQKRNNVLFTFVGHLSAISPEGLKWRRKEIAEPS